MTSRIDRRAMSLLLTGAAAAVGAAVPAGASAASETVSVANGTLTVTASGGTANNITMDGFDANNYSVAGNSPVAGTGCTQQTATSVLCPKAGTARILVSAGDLNDNVTVEDTSVKIPSRLYGGLGNDRLSGGGGSDYVNGGLGADSFRGHGGNDVFSARDYRRDTFFECDAGVDTLYADRLDPRLYMIGCERILLPPIRR
jgi:Ca2+-binding RTX toxin-like protein